MCVAVLSLPHLTPQFEVNARQLTKQVKYLASILSHSVPLLEKVEYLN